MFYVNDPGYDALLRNFELATDESELALASTAADRYIIENHWSLYMFPLVRYTVYQPYLKVYSGEHFGRSEYQRWARFWIDQDLKKSIGP